MLKNDTGQDGIPYGANGVFIDAVTSLFFQQLHQRFIGNMAKNQLQSLQISEIFDLGPVKERLGCYNGHSFVVKSANGVQPGALFSSLNHLGVNFTGNRQKGVNSCVSRPIHGRNFFSLISFLFVVQ